MMGLSVVGMFPEPFKSVPVILWSHQIPGWDSVMSCSQHRGMLDQVLNRAQVVNPYGDGSAAERIVAALS